MISMHCKKSEKWLDSGRSLANSNAKCFPDTDHWAPTTVPARMHIAARRSYASSLFSVGN